MQDYDIINDNLSYYSSYRKSKVYCMCAPISKIRGKTALDLLELCNQTNNIPVDLKEMINKLDISCMEYDFSELDCAWQSENGTSEDNPILGALVTNGDEAVIFYKDKFPEDTHRYRFTIAHELAHVCLQHYNIGDSSVHLAFRHEKNANAGQEFDANIFAGQLLIPQHSLERVLKELFFPSLKILADLFAVSTSVMKARLDQLEITKKIIGYNC